MTVKFNLKNASKKSHKKTLKKTSEKITSFSMQKIPRKLCKKMNGFFENVFYKIMRLYRTKK